MSGSPKPALYLLPVAQPPANVGQNWSKKSNCRVFAQSHISRKLHSTSEYTWLASRRNKDFFSPFLFAFNANETLDMEFTGKYMALDALFYVGPRDCVFLVVMVSAEMRLHESLSFHLTVKRSFQPS